MKRILVALRACYHPPVEDPLPRGRFTRFSMAHDVFISYASSDKVVADAVCSQLESLHHIRCWIAPRDVTPGASWAESIIDALDESKIMVLIFSNNANASM